MAGQVACPPYDVLNEEQVVEIAAGNQLSFVRVIRAEVDFDPGTDSHRPEVYAQGRANLDSLTERGVLIRDESPCLYIYRMLAEGHTQYGLVAGVSVEEYHAGRIKPHEHTRPEKVDDRAHHIEVLGANTGPVLLAYPDADDVTQLVRRVCTGCDPLCECSGDDGVLHALWRVADRAKIDELRSAFSDIPALYIADGHHRAAAAARLHENEPAGNRAHFLGVCFPASEMRILGYHRLVLGLTGLGAGEFLRRVEERFEVTAADGKKGLPREQGVIGMFLAGRWYHLRARPGTWPAGDPVVSLDAEVLQAELLRPVLGIADPRTDGRLDFIGGHGSITQIESRLEGRGGVAFALAPVAIEQMMRVADAGRVMPPKSTWFEPKLRSGLIIRPL